MKFKLWRILMALSDDLKTLTDNVASLTTAVNALVAAYQANTTPPGTAEAIQAAAAQAATLTSDINAVLNPPPAP